MQGDSLQSLSELLCLNEETKKACVLGVVVDATAVYKVSENKDYIRKVKIIDKSLNPNNRINGMDHCTIMFFADSPDQLPAPTQIGQVLYLRRYDFNIWNDKFQGKRTAGNISSWTLLGGGFEEKEDCIATTKQDFNLTSEKYYHLLSPIHQIRSFAREYFENNNVLIRDGNEKDSDYILQVKDALNQDYTLTNGLEDYKVTIVDQKLGLGSIIRLRSVSRIEGNRLIKNPYTWALEILSWMRSSKQLFFNASKKKSGGEEFTTIKDLLRDKDKYEKNQQFKLLCEVVDIQPKTFKQAVKYYSLKHNFYNDMRTSKQDVPMYAVKFLLRDKSGNSSQQLEVQLCSWDGKGGDFIPQVDLNLLQLSSLVAESQLYETRINNLLEKSSLDNPVVATVEYVSTPKGPAFRLIKLQ